MVHIRMQILIRELANQCWFIVICLVAFTLFAQEGTFQFLGLPSERITTIVVHPKNDSILYVGTASDFSAGTYGCVFKSIDAGITWDTLLYPVSPIEIVIHPLHPDTVYIALGGDNFTTPGILKTTNGGEKWFWADSGIYVDGEIFVQALTIHTYYPDTLYAGTAGIFPGHLYKTYNGGHSWRRIIYGPEIEEGPIEITLNPIYPDTIFIGENGTGEIYKSIDAGSTWFALDVPWYTYGLPFCIEIDPRRSSIIYAGVYQYGMMMSTDGGKTWTQVDSGLPDNRIRALVFDRSDPNHLYTGLYEYGVFESTNRGNYWSGINAGLNNKWVTALAITDHIIYAGTYEGLYGRKIVTTLEHEDDNYYTQYRLDQNYPNPFNNQTTIQYHIPQSSFASLIIYNLRGQVIRQLVNKYHTPGEYRVQWNGKNQEGGVASNGLYFYKLSTDDFNKTQILLYLK